MALKCPKCHHENPDDTIYCGKCATPLQPSKDISVTKTLITSARDLLEGTTFAGRYHIIEELGRGGMGVVYKAEDSKLKRTVALKFLPPELTHIPDVKDRFMREAQAAAALDHPNICTVYEFDEAEEKTFISMAYVEGQSLRKKLESGPLELDEALRIATQIAQGLQIAHKKGVVHRDIKSANIMVTEDNQAKIMDFGLARMTGGTLITQEGTAMGTVAYMSPEQAKGETVDLRTDIWSLGVVFYEMLSGGLPFRGDHEQTLLYSILQHEPERLTKFRKDLPPGLENIVFKALSKRSTGRYQTVEEMLGDLKAIADGLRPVSGASLFFRGRVLGIKKTYAYPALAGLIIMTVLAVLFVFPKRAQALDSIAVLPFENVNADSNTDYLCDGIAESIINKLSQLSAFKLGSKTVINRASAFTYKGKTVDPKKVGQELGVKAVLLTRLVRQGDRLTVSPTLVRAEDGGQLWGERYDRKFGDIQAIEENIENSIVQALGLKLTEIDRQAIAAREINNAAAYEYYLKARQEIERYREDAVDRAIEYLQSGFALVGDNALLYSAMAYAYYQFANLGVREEDSVAKAEEYANKALALDASSPTALVVLGLLGADSPGKQKESLRYLKKALSLSPNDPVALTWLATLYCQPLGKITEGLQLTERLARVDPLNLIVYNLRAAAYWHDGRFDLALEQVSEGYQLDSANPGTAALYATILIRNRKIDEASSVIDQMVQTFRDSIFTKMALVDKCAFLNDRTNLFKIMIPDFQESMKMGGLASSMLASALALIGEKEEALDWLENAVNRGFINYPFLAEKDPWLGSIRGEARFKKLLERVKYEWEHFED
jgi:serine/threonine protein kinase/tetratricopeptide (TPR) repeat protein